MLYVYNHHKGDDIENSNFQKLQKLMFIVVFQAIKIVIHG